MNNFEQLKKSRIAAFTLSELLVVLVIIGILVLLALPVLMPQISKAKSVEAKQYLRHLETLQKTYFYEYSRYSPSLEEIGFEQEMLVTDGGKANYMVEIVEASPTTYVARATAVVDFDKDGNFNTWEVDQEGMMREVLKD